MDSDKRIIVPIRPVVERIKDFNEVVLGYSKEAAEKEAKRCIMCKDKPCIKGCPVGIDIPAFIEAILDDDIEEAYWVIQNSNSLPAVCGRICPQEDQCAKVCTPGKGNDPVNIGLLERYVSDMAIKENIDIFEGEKDEAKPSLGVIGAGPAGLTIAGDMIRSGYPVVIYEALHESGGVLKYGIPEFRLPNKVIDDEVKELLKCGVEIKTNHVIGRTLTLEELRKRHEAVFIGVGAGSPEFMGIKGENLNGVYSANEYLIRNNLMKSYKYPVYPTPLKSGKVVAVVGGGNAAMDSARAALRLGVEKVYNIYRCSMREMSARIDEIENAVKEGVEVVVLTDLVEISGDKNGYVKGIKCIKMELGEPDELGCRLPVKVPESEFEINVDVVVMAVGTSPSRVLLESAEELELNGEGYIKVNEATGKTNLDNVYAGGDIVTGSATVIGAMGDARKAGKAIKENFKNGCKR